jgi:hypothetical protein
MDDDLGGIIFSERGIVAGCFDGECAYCTVEGIGCPVWQFLDLKWYGWDVEVDWGIDESGASEWVKNGLSDHDPQGCWSEGGLTGVNPSECGIEGGGLVADAIDGDLGGFMGLRK